MSRTLSLDAIILRVFDIGEADRFCVFFTREKGRLAARARSVRKTTSRLGGTLLPFRHIKLQISESEHSSVVTGAADIGDVPVESLPLHAFLRLQRGMELLLALTEDHEPIPAVFDLLLQFMVLAPADDCDPLSAFQLRLLHLLGLLPASDTDARFHALAEDAKQFVLACTKTSSLDALCRMPHSQSTIDSFIRLLVGDQLNRQLKSVGVQLD
ncbi:MAG TPA: recombination protein O N-terminal domain-containing protein [Candidatus Peribacteraceae bacterium]|nr:recombination protein O N-terminal domain-containing protein [Candidatus Peribacteraceae bacterium]